MIWLFKSGRCQSRASGLILTDFFLLQTFYSLSSYFKATIVIVSYILSEVVYLCVNIIYIYHCRVFVIRNNKLYKVTSMLQYSRF